MPEQLTPVQSRVDSPQLTEPEVKLESVETSKIEVEVDALEKVEVKVEDIENEPVSVVEEPIPIKPEYDETSEPVESSNVRNPAKEIEEPIGDNKTKVNLWENKLKEPNRFKSTRL